MSVVGSDMPERRTLLVAAGLLWTAFCAVAASVKMNWLAAFDLAGLTIWREPSRLAVPLGPDWLPEAVRDVTALGGPVLRNLFALLAIAVLLALGQRGAAGRVLLIVGGGWLVDVVLKQVIKRTRPLVVPHLMAASGSSFPSGHSFNAAVVYVGLALVVTGFGSTRALRVALIGSALVLSALIALSRVWLGVHYPTDALGGWLGGVGWAFLAGGLLSGDTRRARRCADPPGSGKG